MMDSTVRTVNLTRRYPMGEQVVEAPAGVDLEVRRGEFVAAVGVSGSGKSTLLHLIGGLDRPTAGQVWVNGVELGAAGEADERIHLRSVKLFRPLIVETDRGGHVQWSDEELVRRHLRGDKHAFRELVERYTRSVYNLAYRFTGDRAEAEDIVQETFLRVYQALPNSRLDLPFKPWLFRIAVNLCRDWARKRRPALFSTLDVGQGSISADVERDGISPYEEIPDDAPLPLEQIEAEEMKRLLAHAVAELPEPYRLAVTLRYNEGLSYQEIADVLGQPLNTVRTHLFRAKRLLRRALERRLGVNP